MHQPAATPSSTPIAARSGGEMRLLSRLSVAFLLDLVSIARRGRHVLDALLLTTIVQSNVAEISRRADLQVQYADANTVPPDELRRPVSLNALATSLGQPYETVRRRVGNLAKEGIVDLVPGGAIVPAAVLTSPEYLQSGFQAYERMRRFYYELADLGLLGDLPPRNAELAPGAFPLRTMARLTSDYVLRVIEAIIVPMGDLMDGLIFLEAFRCNVEHLPLEPWGPDGLDPGAMVDDELRRPVTVSALAERLGLANETVRRHVTRLEAAGALVRRPGGFIAPAAALGRPELQQAIVGNVANLQRLFAALAQLGVLDLWNSAR
jgi:DNA-binding transcriptional ArsR family regulator